MKEFSTHKINPYIREAIHSIVAVGGHMKRRIIYDYLLIYVERGLFTYHYDGINYLCDTGKVLLIRPGISHGFDDVIEELSQPHIHFDIAYHPKSEELPICFRDRADLSPSELQLIQEDVFSDYPSVIYIQVGDMDRFLQLFYGVIREHISSPLMAKAHMIEILDMIARENFPDSFSDLRRDGVNISLQIKNYIDADQSDNMSLGDFEKRFSYSRYYLEREFKKEYGVSIIAYRNDKILQRARELLKTETVSRVSDLLHFSSIYAFSRAFKNKFGISPSYYRKQFELTEDKYLQRVLELLKSTGGSQEHVARILGYSSEDAFVKDFKSNYGLWPTEIEKRFFRKKKS